METNRILAQSEPAQTSISESVTAANPASADPTTANPDSVGSEASLPSAEPAPVAGMQTPPESSLPRPLYNPGELNDIVRYLTTEGLFDPEYILLFGSLTGGIPHSEAKCYDLLVAVRDMPAYDWWHAKHDLRYKLPIQGREIVYTDIYIVSLNHLRDRRTPFLYYALCDGRLVYCRETFQFRRPTRKIDFIAAHCDAGAYFDTFKTLADTMLDCVQSQLGRRPSEMRLAAYLTFRAAATYYKVLYYVYHNDKFAGDDLLIMHERMRTLSTELMMLFNDTHVESNTTLGWLQSFARYALTMHTFMLPADELHKHVGRVVRMGEIVAKCCRRRLNLYVETSGR